MNSVKESQAEKNTHGGNEDKTHSMIEFLGREKKWGECRYILGILSKEDFTPLKKVFCYIN